ncbi:MAG: hypothetical protein HQL46_13610, partial [Gammaproteobacteria bacterium]|nr:hypothetical protein [Gammaproteobacteria bacterium]
NAVGGEVNIDVSGVSGDPQATIQKAQQIRRAATAPAEPSSKDRQVAAEASRMEAEARQAQTASMQAGGTSVSSSAPSNEDDSVGQSAGISIASIANQNAANFYQNVASYAGKKDSLEYLTDYG